MKNIDERELNLLINNNKNNFNLLTEKNDNLRYEKDAIGNFKVFLMHLFKYEFQKERQTRSWIESITGGYKKFIEAYEKATKNSKKIIEDKFKDMYEEALNDFYKQTNYNKYEFKRANIDIKKYKFDDFLKFDLKKFLNDNKYSIEAIEYMEKYNERNK